MNISMLSSEFVSFNFYPVGQGLFCSGNFLGLSWIYDCGTASSNKYLTHSIEKYNEIHKETEVDFFVISHFDNDHISGIISLLKTKKVRRILLPLTSLWQRVGILFSKKRYISKQARDFIINPSGFLLEKMNANEIGRSEIIFMPSYPRDTPEQQDNLSSPENGLRVNIVDEIPWKSIPSVCDEEKNVCKLNNIKALDFDCCLSKKITPDTWVDFLFYTEPVSMKVVETTFLREVNEVAKILLHSKEEILKKDALSKIKKMYESKFKTQVERNKISTFMFLKLNSTCGEKVKKFDGNVALFTGDGFLSDPKELIDLNKFSNSYTPFILQVMHHGSKANWHYGLGRKLKPRFSIFSSDPKRKRPSHPDKEVVEDFKKSSKVIYVTKEQGVSFIIDWRRYQIFKLMHVCRLKRNQPCLERFIYFRHYWRNNIIPGLGSN